jgi:Holliday junction resolvasome RuvABC endonuclease subunit
MSKLLALDPGTTETGWCIYRDGKVDDSGISSNEDVLAAVYAWPNKLAIEMIASYGMAVGKEVFETCVWIGRFIQAYQYPAAVRIVYRKDVKLHLCGTTKAKDTNIRVALIDLLGAPGTKKNPGPTFGVKSHAWAALGVAVTADHQMQAEAA